MEVGSLDWLVGGLDYLMVDGGGGIWCILVGILIGLCGKDVVLWVGMFEMGFLWLGMFELMVLDDIGSCFCIWGDGRVVMGDGCML